MVLRYSPLATARHRADARYSLGTARRCHSPRHLQSNSSLSPQRTNGTHAHYEHPSRLKMLNSGDSAKTRLPVRPSSRLLFDSMFSLAARGESDRRRRGIWRQLAAIT
jgi:hypothetical protein